MLGYQHSGSHVGEKCLERLTFLTYSFTLQNDTFNVNCVCLVAPQTDSFLPSSENILPVFCWNGGRTVIQLLSHVAISLI